MRNASCLAPAKINLALHVTGKRPDGYHTLDTLVAFCDLADRVDVSPATGAQDTLGIGGPFANLTPGQSDNLILQAANALRACQGDQFADRSGKPSCPPVSVQLQKNLPVAAGIGGGSADAAATLLALQAAWRTSSICDLEQIGIGLGADIPMCLHSRPLRATGIGELIEPVTLANDMPVLLANPAITVATADVFAALEQRDNSPIAAASHTGRVTIEALSRLRNDLEDPAKRLEPVIGEVLETLRVLPGCGLARMSGSGATCFALFETMEEAVAAGQILATEKPHWWLHCGHLLTGPVPDRLTLQEEA